ncbi:MAG: GNAT family N-acetyltransferase [Candidatus Dormibacteraeota bacterium]|nr:GNAT family N-acetyltransferase [Candidatus Dormibacteraeota bacterium]MBV8445834.1 GNAT family N-acetyltransferase [Candidatus Dormibacteraeota bacterium]
MSSGATAESVARSVMGYVRSVSTARSEVVRSAPFVAILARGNPGRHWNYAIPDDDAEPTAEEVEALARLFTDRGLSPRVELVRQAAPAVPAALEAAGFSVDEDLPLMTCTQETAVALPVPDGITLCAPATDAELLAMAAMQHRNFGEPLPAGRPDVDRQRGTLSQGGILLMALNPAGEVVGAGVAAPEHARTREIVGVAVEAAWRRRGIAGAVVAAITAEALSTGCDSVFLEAAPGAGGAYERAGFRYSASAVHYAR